MSSTEIASLPTGWEACCFGDIARIRNGYAFKSELFKKTKEHESDVPLIRQSQMKGSRIDTSDAVFLSGEHLKKHPDFVIAKGDVIIGMSGSIGKVCLYDEDFPALQNQRTGKIVPHLASELNPKFFGLFLSNIERELTEYAKGMGVQNISAKDIELLLFNLPPKNEQHRIVAKIEALFSELDKGIENLKTAREQLKVYRQALLKHAFEGKLTVQWRAANPDKLEPAAALLARIQTEREQRYRQQLQQWEATGGSKPKAPKPLPPLTAEELAELPILPEGWGWCKWEDILLSEKGAFKRGPFGSALKKEFFVKSGYKVYEQYCPINDDCSFERYYISDEKFRELEGFSVRADDFLVSCSGVTLGRITQVPPNFKEGIINQALLRVRVSKAVYDFQFFKTFFRSRYFQKRIFENSTGTAIPNVKGVNELKAIPLPLCSLLEQQQIMLELEARVSEVDQLELTLTTSLQQAEALRQSILKKAFSGQLVAQDANDEPASILLERIKAEKAVPMAKPHTARQVVDPKPVQSNVIPFPVKLPNISATDLHAGILARAYQHHENAPKYLAYFGHVKAEKIAHLVEAHLGIDLEREPIKDAAGPNDYPHLMKVESRARKANWFDVRKKKGADAYEFSKKHGFDTLLLKTRNALGERAAEVDALIELLLPLNSRQAEILATLYAAWNNLLLQGQSPGDEAIVHEARENWHAAKLKIERDKFFWGLQWMYDNGLVPSGKGRYVGGKASPKSTRKPS